MVCVCSLECVF